MIFTLYSGVLVMCDFRKGTRTLLSNGKTMLHSLSVLRGILPVTAATIKRDGLAGIVLASMNIPQVLGYARIAGMPAITGLYTAFLPIIAFAFFGASRHLVVAADSATATILATRLSLMAPVFSLEYVTLAGMVTLLTAILLMIARIFRLGFLADFLSRTVLIGFLAGVGVQVAMAMFGDMTGISFHSSRTIIQVQTVMEHFSEINGNTFFLSLLVVSSIIFFKHYAPRWPVSFFVVTVSILCSAFFDFSGHGIAVLGPVTGGLPSLHWPSFHWDEMLALVPVAASCCVMILAQSTATSRVFAQRYHEKTDINADILGLAMANISAGLSGTFVVNGSPTQTAMSDSAGARSQVAQVFFAATVGVVLLLFSRFLQYLPHAVLSSLVFTIAVGLINIQSLRDIRKESPGEFYLALFTAATVVLVGVEFGILMAIVLSLLRHVRHSYQPHTMVMATNERGQWQSVPAVPGTETTPGLIIFRFEADLFYANDHFFVAEIQRLIQGAPNPVHCLVIDASAITDIDYSAARSLSELCFELGDKKITVLFARVNPYLRDDLDRHGITALIGPERICATLHEALAMMECPPKRG